MRKHYLAFVVYVLFTLSVVAQDVFVPEAGATYMIKNKSGQVFTVFPDEGVPIKLNHHGNADLPPENQYFQFVAVDGAEGTYNIKSVPTNRYVALTESNTWDGALVEDVTLTRAQFTIEYADPSHSYLRNVSNSKYVAPDEQSKPLAGVYFDKDQSEKAYWQILKQEVTPNSVGVVADETVKVYVKNGYIRVEGVENFKVYSVTGAEVNAANILNAGIYIVLVNDKQFKVLVN